MSSVCAGFHPAGDVVRPSRRFPFSSPEGICRVFDRSFSFRCSFSFPVVGRWSSGQKVFFTPFLLRISVCMKSVLFLVAKVFFFFFFWVPVDTPFPCTSAKSDVTFSISFPYFDPSPLSFGFEDRFSPLSGDLELLCGAGPSSEI